MTHKVVHSFLQFQHSGGSDRWISEFKVNLVYIQWDLVSKIKPNKIIVILMFVLSLHLCAFITMRVFLVVCCPVSILPAEPVAGSHPVGALYCTRICRLCFRDCTDLTFYIVLIPLDSPATRRPWVYTAKFHTLFLSDMVLFSTYKSRDYLSRFCRYEIADINFLKMK